jgi:putative ABC transport system substrate-binding protein
MKLADIGLAISAMRRRDFIALMGASVTWPFAAMAQEPGRTYRLGSLFRAPRSDPNLIAFFEGMGQYGFVEGQNLSDDPNGYELRIEQFAGHASEIVKQGVDLIVCAGDDAIRAAQQATKVIPILGGTDDMFGSVRSTGQCNSACSLSAGVWKPKVFRGR